MPTPLGHALAGIAVAGVASSGRRLPAAHLGILVFCATAADLDLVLRFIDGVNHHRGASHSFGAAVLVAVVGFVLGRLGVKLPAVKAMSAAWASHVVLDFLGLDTAPPFGEMALWPVSTDFYVSPIAVFYDVRRSFSWSALRHNAVAVAIELVVLVPIVLLCWRSFPFRKSKTQ